VCQATLECSIRDAGNMLTILGTDVKEEAPRPCLDPVEPYRDLLRDAFLTHPHPHPLLPQVLIEHFRPKSYDPGEPVPASLHEALEALRHCLLVEEAEAESFTGEGLNEIEAEEALEQVPYVITS
jgi:hypothetical protein